jgi:uncharacterized protein with gpF-like domain
MTDPLSLPFDEAIAFFRQKLNLPTATWQDIWHDMHARAFVVAGAMKDDLLDDIRESIDEALAEGTTIAQFQNDFDDIVARHGWAYKGGRKWRAAVIFNTNISVAYAVGHYQAMMDPAVREARPYLRYIASSSRDPRPEHRAWYNVILPADDPWWDTHYPPNGWGCKCGVVSHSAREVERIRAEEKDGDKPVRTRAPKTETYEWIDNKGAIHNIPDGIDPGWDYNPGKAGFEAVTS